jgi:hypothetical protein
MRTQTAAFLEENRPPPADPECAGCPGAVLVRKKLRTQPQPVEAEATPDENTIRAAIAAQRKPARTIFFMNISFALVLGTEDATCAVSAVQVKRRLRRSYPLVGGAVGSTSCRLAILVNGQRAVSLIASPSTCFRMRGDSTRAVAWP